MGAGFTGSGEQSAGLQIAPFVTFRPNGNPSEDPETTPAQQNFNPTVENENVLAGHVRLCWQRNKLFKERIQLELLDCLRAKSNVYSNAELATMEMNGGANFVWIPLTETKTRACSAWMREVLLPVSDRAWQLTTGALPQMPIEFQQALIENSAEKAKKAMHGMAQSSGGIMSHAEFREMAWEIHNEMRDEVLKRAKKLADATAMRMENKIEEILQDGGYYQAMDEIVEDFSVYKAAILCGPIHERKKSIEWLPGWKMGVKNDVHQTFMRIDPFDAFPAPYAQSCQKGDFIVRRRFRRDELFNMIGVPGYREDMIRECLRAYSNGHLETWLWTEAERQRLTNETMYTFLSPWGIIDALWYWGSVPGWKLMSWGLEGADDLDPVRDYEVESMVIGSYVIMCRINPDPMGRRPFHKACYSAKPGAFWGLSVPELAKTSQKMCNAAASALADNMGMASGPMVWIHNDRLADGENTVDIYPWRIWQMKSDPSQGVNPGIGFFQANDNSEKLQAIIDKYDQRSDDDTGIPRYTYGNDQQIGGAADTYAGLSMLMNNAAKGLRRAITNVDLNMIQPCLQMVFENEMLYGTDQSLKGDAHIVAKGAAAILVKESQRQGRLQALQLVGTNPMAMNIIGMVGYGEMLKNALRSIDGADDGVVPDENTLQKMQDQQSLQAAQAQQMQQSMATQQLSQQAALAQQANETKQNIAQNNNDTKKAIVGAEIGAKHAEAHATRQHAIATAQPQPAVNQGSVGNTNPTPRTPPTR